MNDAALLAPMYRGEGPTEPAARPLPNLNKYKLRAIAHNKVEFAATKQLVPCNEL